MYSFDSFCMLLKLFETKKTRKLVLYCKINNECENNLSSKFLSKYGCPDIIGWLWIQKANIVISMCQIFAQY